MKSYTIFFLTSLFLLLLSCSKYSDYLYEVIDVKTDNADNTGNEPISLAIDSISKNAYAIQLEYTMTYKGTNGNHDVEYESSFKNEYSVSAFNVYSLENFDANHPAGTSLNEYFLVSQGSPYGQYNSSNTITSIIGTGNIGSGKLEENGGPSFSNWTSKQFLILMQPPTNSGSYSFVVEITQTNNTTISDTTTIILY